MFYIQPKQILELFEKKLGPRVNRKIPVKVKTENGYTTNETEVLQEWKTDFSKLLNNTNDTYYDNHCLDNVDRSLLYFETQMETENFVQNAMINTDITINEVEVAVTKLKNGKATGVDIIPNEVIEKPVAPVIPSVLWKWSGAFNMEKCHHQSNTEMCNERPICTFRLSGN